MSKEYCVYCHTNKVNGKKYIGVTSTSVEQRWHNGEGYRSQYFYRAIKKYGWDGFTHEVLYDGLTAEYAGEIEMYLIAKYKTFDRQYGYNIEHGGVARQYVSEETRKRLRESHLGQKCSDERRKFVGEFFTGRTQSAEHRAKIGAAQRKINQTASKKETVEKQWKTDKRLSDEHKRHISEAGKGKRTGKDNHMAKAVICIETGQRFDTIKDASEWVGVSVSAVKNVLYGHGHTAGGYRWAYASQIDTAV